MIIGYDVDSGQIHSFPAMQSFPTDTLHPSQRYVGSILPPPPPPSRKASLLSTFSLYHGY